MNDTQNIRDHLLNIYEQPIRNAKINQYDLTKYVEASEKTWLSFVEKELRA